MIKTFLIQRVIEECIDVFFKSVSNTINDSLKIMPRVGDFYSKVTAEYHLETVELNNCHVSEVGVKEVFGEKINYMIVRPDNLYNIHLPIEICKIRK